MVLSNGYARYNSFYNYTGTNAIYSRNADYEYNWWGTNNPNFNNIVSGSYRPKTWLIMNLTPNNLISSNGGTVTLQAGIYTLYNSSTGTYYEFDTKTQSDCGP